MASTRIRKIGGIYSDKGFKKLLSQLNGRAVVVVVVVNTNCTECVKIQKFIAQLQHSLIHKLPQLVMLYGYNNAALEESERDGKKKKAPKPDPKAASGKNGQKEDKPKKLGDTNILDWEEMDEGHGYAIFISETDVQHYRSEFDHNEFATNILDNVRRFNSSIRTLAGLPAKRQFLEKKRSGIIIETGGTVQQSQIIEVENKIKKYQSKIKVPIYFCKGLTQEISLVQSGEVSIKIKGLNFDKFVRKLPR